MFGKLKGFFSRSDASVGPSAAVWFDRGNDFVSRQQWQLSLDCYCEAIRLDPGHAEAHAYRGNVLRQLRDFDAAIQAYDRALALRPGYAEVHYNRGTLLQQARRLPAALQSLDAALAVNAVFAQAHARRADVLGELGQLKAAIASYRQAIWLMPHEADAHFNLGVLLSNVGDHADSLKSFDEAIAIDSRHAGAHGGRGVALLRLGQARTSLECFDTAIRLKPDVARFFSNRAQAEASLGLWSEARASHTNAVLLDPQDSEIHFNEGAFLSDRKQWRTAADSYQRAIACRPHYGEAFCNLGQAQQEMGESDAAFESYARALSLNPRLAAIFNNRGNLFRSRKQFADALRDYRDALSLDAHSVDAHYNVGQLALIQADFETGWREYEWRTQIEEAKPASSRKLQSQAWSGEPSLKGRRILLYAEQGLGDTIQFCRYASCIAARHAHVILEVQPALGGLLSNLEGVSELILAGSAVPQADFHCSLMSLPWAFKTRLDTIPCRVPYVHPDPKIVERSREMLGQAIRPRVGLAWSGNRRHSNDDHRSLTLRQLAAYLPRELEYYCLQNEIRDTDREFLRSCPEAEIHVLPVSSFPDTAALIQMLDLVVSVDTSIAHLSAAMGKNTWILLPFLPDWRWLLDRNDSPWYPTVTLYRQTAPRDWDGVMSEVSAELSAWGSELQQSRR